MTLFQGATTGRSNLYTRLEFVRAETVVLASIAFREIVNKVKKFRRRKVVR